MLDLFQIKNGRFKKNEAPSDIRKNIQMLVEMVRIQTTEKNLLIELIPSPEMPDTIILDAQRIRQVYLNLLQNAIKFTFKGGIKIFIDYDPQTKYLIGRVEDTGIGITEDDQQTLFSIFGKLKST